MHTPEKPILLVEDNRDDEELTTMSLREAGVKNPIHVVRDGVAALAWLRACDSESLPAVVLLDLGLPMIDGFGVLTELRANPVTKALPVVILTSSDVEEDIARGYRLGVNSYVRKPVDFDDFVTAVRSLGLYWVLLNRPPLPDEGGRP